MTARTDLAYGFSPGFSPREIVHWTMAALVVLAAHGIIIYAFQNLRTEPVAEGVDSAMMIELAPLAVSTPEAVEQEMLSEEAPSETLTPVEPTETVAETLDPVEPVQPEESITPVPNEKPEPVETEQAEAVAPEEVTPEEITPDAVEPEEVTPDVVEPEEEAPEMANVVLPQTDIPLPTPRPERPRPVKEQPRQERPRRAEAPVKRTREPARTETRRSAAPPPSTASRASAPRVSPARWQSKVVAWLNRHKRYPRSARSRGEEGTVQVRFTINASGTVTSVRITRSSGNAALDEAAVDMVRRASPVPAPPPQIAQSSMSLSVPVSFNLR
ncbi:protein TonB [Mesorhizobium sp. J18]|uniref:energy transducer TonB family protein n=1 Tax=Mesorhizobium sp. J18 TaxID=935263 RepID=UPI00119C80A1|nr:energy transducer TonB [Mesorhizobium sp. J18]TWG98313.1 protein TonB [Mesorhizobium sp. J18]